MRLCVEGASSKGEVNFYDMGDGSEIAEMRIFRATDGEQVFFLHFMMEDEARARELFHEMRDALLELAERCTMRVLLCCTCGVTTTMFAQKMNVVATTLGLDYAFAAKPLERLLEEPESFDAVLLAPQVGYQRQKVLDALPGTLVIELPGKVFGSYDAAAAVRLVTSAFDREEAQADSVDEPARIVRGGDYGGRFLVVSAVLGTRSTGITWRVYDSGKVVLEGTGSKVTFEFRDVEDAIAAARLQGLDPASLDAVGIAVPGLVHEGVASLGTRGVPAYDLRGHMEEAYGIPVFVDNDTNAAVTGCYVMQEAYESVMFHRQPTGALTCGQGTIINGRLVTGRHHLSGEMFYLEHYLVGDLDPDVMWTEEGNVRAVSRYLLCNICTVAPDAIFVDAAMVGDLELLREELATQLPRELIPDLVMPPADFNELMLAGELALCAQRIAKG